MAISPCARRVRCAQPTRPNSWRGLRTSSTCRLALVYHPTRNLVHTYALVRSRKTYLARKIERPPQRSRACILDIVPKPTQCNTLHRVRAHLAAAGVEVELAQAVGGVHELLLLEQLVEQLVPQHELRRIVHPSLFGVSMFRFGVSMFRFGVRCSGSVFDVAVRCFDSNNGNKNEKRCRRNDTNVPHEISSAETTSCQKACPRYKRAARTRHHTEPNPKPWENTPTNSCTSTERAPLERSLAIFCRPSPRNRSTVLEYTGYLAAGMDRRHTTHSATPTFVFCLMVLVLL